MKLLNNLNFKLGVISTIVTICFLIVLPKINVNIDNSLFRLNSQIGGYNISFLQDRFVFNMSEFKMGLDIKGGIRLVLLADMSKIDADQKDNALESAKEIISKRINFLGVSEPNIVTSKTNQDYRIIVELPGITDLNEATNIIGKTAQ